MEAEGTVSVRSRTSIRNSLRWLAARRRYAVARFIRIVPRGSLGVVCLLL